MAYVVAEDVRSLAHCHSFNGRSATQAMSDKSDASFDITQRMPNSKAQHEYELRVVDRIEDVDAHAWQRLVPNENGALFVSWDFLHCLETSGSLRLELGWRAQHALLYHTNVLVAAAPIYIKHNSHGEFVFDHNWAATYRHYQQRYFPKLLCGIPYTPITGPRLLATNEVHRLALLQALLQNCADGRFSSLHLNFVSESQAAWLTRDDQWLPRSDWQFHWQRQAHWHQFGDFLNDFQGKKRRNILQERQKVAAAGLHYSACDGHHLSEQDWRAIHQLYQLNFDDKGNVPALTLEFFLDYAKRAPDQVVVFRAHSSKALDADSTVAMALCFKDQDTLFGRYWGATDSARSIAGLHFECCYYQGLEYCFAHGLRRFEPGAQGEHKIARGFLPTKVRSAHHICLPEFRRAFRFALADEAEQRQAYGDILLRSSPFR